MKYIGADDTEEAVIAAAENVLEALDRVPFDRATVRDPDGCHVDKRQVLTAMRDLRRVLVGYERRQLYRPRSSVDLEQAASIRTVGGSSPSGGSA